MTSLARRAVRALSTPEQRRSVGRFVFRARTALTGRHAVVPRFLSAAAARMGVGRKPTLYQLEVHVADRCNLNCRGCGHFSPLVRGEDLPSLDAYQRDLAQLARLFASIDEIWLLGGEPLLHPQVLDFVRATRAAFPRTRLGLVSNGVLVASQDISFWATLAENDVLLRLSGYPIDVDYDALLARADSHGVRADMTPWRDEFYKMPIRPAGDLDPARMLAECRQHFDCPYLENGSIYHCARMPQSRYLARRFEVSLGDGADAGFALDSARDGYEVLRYLSRPNDWCRFCDAEHREHFTWEHTAWSADEWLGDRP